MTELACTWVRDHLPEHARAALDFAERERLGKHLEQCAECRAAADLIRLVAEPVSPPAGLEERIVAALGSESRAGSGHGVRHYAIAAVFAFAVITGSLLWRVIDRGPAVIPDVSEADAIAWPIGGDPLLHESPGLHSLSEEELVILLQEMES